MRKALRCSKALRHTKASRNYVPSKTQQDDFNSVIGAGMIAYMTTTVKNRNNEPYFIPGIFISALFFPYLTMFYICLS